MVWSGFPSSWKYKVCIAFCAMGQGLAGHLRAVNQLIVFQALRLEWVKLMFFTSSSHLSLLFCQRRSVGHRRESVGWGWWHSGRHCTVSQSVSQQGTCGSLRPLGMESLAALLSKMTFSCSKHTSVLAMWLVMSDTWRLVGTGTESCWWSSV